ncbi:hypothetical protein MKK88_05570 [Methylobacterium sp. E-005]|uniref:hypothetical protein n=1 Tax=Methylobacterium sp. E-005 TaxID=2836549 RepID=UPI001FB8D86A|nr:hypothetical protein [Methylobacterium sp. E-005]MCJ2085463.1 hypothetical protein [Methylobacterium sp. E-005]
MSKPPVPKLSQQGIFGKAHNHATTQTPDDAPAQLRDDEIPGGKGQGRAARGTREGDAHRSLYAKPETFDLIRRLAFEKNTTAQALYREGLLLMLQKHGQAPGRDPEDI